MTRATVTGVFSGQVSSVSSARCGELPIGRRNRIAVRIELRMPEHLVDALDQPIRDDVLHLLRVVVDLVPVHAHDLHEEQLDQAVTTEHARGEFFAGGRQAHAVVRLVADEP